MDRLRSEIHQTRPFRSVEQEAFLNVLRTADHLSRSLHETLKPAGLSATQYNVLRILRGAGEEGLSCQECSARMIAHDPDVTRLLDRLEKRSLIRRERSTQDRRVVRTFITDEGLRLLAELDEPIHQLHDRQLGHLGPEKLGLLIGLLEEARKD